VVPEIIVVLHEQYMDSSQDIILHQHSKVLQNVKKIHDVLSYPLLFPDGRCRWSFTFKANTRVALKSFVQYMLQKQPKFNVLHRVGRLFEQYVVDQYLYVEHKDLLFIMQH